VRSTIDRLTLFRINTCESVSKQMTLTHFRMNTYEKHSGRGALSLSTCLFLRRGNVLKTSSFVSAASALLKLSWSKECW
jgi:hypothetical protein